MGKFTFVCTTANYSFESFKVSFKSQDSVYETIEVALDYDQPGNEGLIGKGASKMGIYVRKPRNDKFSPANTSPLFKGTFQQS